MNPYQCFTRLRASVEGTENTGLGPLSSLLFTITGGATVLRCLVLHRRAERRGKDKTLI